MSDVADAVVIGSGPNGLVAAIMLARAGWDVTVLERAAVPGGAVRSEELTKAGYIHDTFSAFYGLLHSSPVFEDLDLGSRIDWIDMETPVAAALDNENAAFVHRDVDATARDLGKIADADEDAWRDLAAWWQKVGSKFFAMTLQPVGAVRPAIRFGLSVGPRRLFQTVKDLVG
ncbi:MAG: FAD-dependent oxidoreductase, partial [Actinobacteria bacterium]|nr:FAD-dependent oxidoreductase [Actinomycetota bacterium]